LKGTAGVISDLLSFLQWRVWFTKVM